MTIISIDFSILYPGVCICKDFKDFKWVSVVNSKITKAYRKKLDDLEISYPDLKILYTNTVRSKHAHYHITERIKLVNYFEIITLLIKELKPHIQKGETIICLEGISFGSSGNALVDISQATGILKQALLNELIDLDFEKFFIFSPGELKNAIECKGNAGKLDIFNKFKEDPIIEEVKSSHLWKAANSEDWFVDNKDRVVSPIMDIVDSYLGVVKIHQLLK